MATEKQNLGVLGEQLVAKACACPQCKRDKTLKRLPPNFKCADIICDFCGYLAQVKTKNVTDTAKLPKAVPGAAWGPQEERMQAGIYFPLFLVLVNKEKPKDHAIYYLSADLQTPDLFKPRKKLSAKAKRARWQGYHYDLSKIINYMIRVG
jgi:type II restriction enzyme